VDYASTIFSVGTYSMPDFWLGMVLLTLFAVTLGWFPVGGLEDPTSTATGVGHVADQAKHMFLPCLTLTVAYLGEYAIIMRSSLLDTMREDYLLLARAKGLRDILVRNRHAVPNAILPVVALLAINFGFVLSGAIAVEAIFSWPGLGLATYDALNGPDLPMLQGLFLVFSASVIFFNFVADLLYGYLDPRVRPA
jgi:peptide/nickel transport system permease protein